MLRPVAVQDLNLVAVLEVHAAVAALLRDEELDVETEVAVLLLRDDIGGAVLATRRDWIVGHEDGAIIDGIVDDLPLDRER